MEQTTNQNKQVATVIEVTAALAEAIRDLGSVPSGHLYASVLHKIDIETYEFCIRMLVKFKQIRKESSHMLVWIGEGRK